MKTYHFLFSSCCLFIILSCTSHRRLPTPTPNQRMERSLYGQWNCYDVQSPSGRSSGIPYQLLDKNEQGFEFREQGIYMPRYFNGQSNAYSTNYDVVGYWGIQEEQYLYFTDRPFEIEEPDFIWEIISFSEQEIWLKDHKDNTVKLRRQEL